MNIKLCIRCKKREVECIDEFISIQCQRSNDKDIEDYQERREFEYYHNE